MEALEREKKRLSGMTKDELKQSWSSGHLLEEGEKEEEEEEEEEVDSEEDSDEEEEEEDVGNKKGSSKKKKKKKKKNQKSKKNKKKNKKNKTKNNSTAFLADTSSEMSRLFDVDDASLAAHITMRIHKIRDLTNTRHKLSHSKIVVRVNLYTQLTKPKESFANNWTQLARDVDIFDNDDKPPTRKEQNDMDWIKLQR
jgi:outer membrane biosynthesis protein TonB